MSGLVRPHAVEGRLTIGIEGFLTILLSERILCAPHSKWVVATIALIDLQSARFKLSMVLSFPHGALDTEKTENIQDRLSVNEKCSGVPLSSTWCSAEG